MSPVHDGRCEDEDHRAPRLARARGGGGPDRGARARAEDRCVPARADMRVPGFRSGKVPPQVVIQRVGREAVLDEAVRAACSALVRGGDRRRRHPAGRRPELDLDDLPEEGEPLDVHDRDRRAPAREARRLQGRRGRPRASPRSTTRRSQAELERLRERSRQLETVDREAGRRRLRGHGLRRARRRRRRSRAARAATRCVELGSGRLIPGFEEQLAGASAGEERTVKLTFPEDYQAERARRPGRRVRRRRSRRSRRRTCPSSTTTSPPRPAASTRSTSCARTSRRASAEAEERAHRGASSARPRSTPPSTRPSRGARRARRTRGRARCGTACRTQARRTRGSTRSRTSQMHRQDGGGDRRAESKPDAEQALQARGRAGGDRRGRGHRGLRRGDARGARRSRAAGRERRAAEEAARAPARAAGADEALREDIAHAQGAWTWWSSRAKPIPSSEAEARGASSGPARSSDDQRARADVRQAAGRRRRCSDSSVAADRRSEDYEPSCSNGRRADLARRARVRHLLAPAQRADRLPRHAGRRRDRQPDRRPAAAPRVRGPRQGHLASTSTRPAARCTRASRSTTRCSSSSPTCRRSASGSRCRWARCCWPAARRASAWRCRTRRS